MRLLLLCLIGCGTSTVEQSREGERIAEVNGEIIVAEDVRAWARDHQVNAETALDALVREALLVAEARRRGLREDPSVVRRAAVQVILSEIEARYPPEDVSPEAVRVEYDTTSERVMANDPNAVMPSFEESVEEIRTSLVGRERLADLQSLLQTPPRLNEERVSTLLELPVID